MSFDEIQKLFDSVMKRVNTFVDMNIEIVEERSKKTQTEVIEGGSKRAGDDLEQESAKRQKLDEHVEAEPLNLQSLLTGKSLKKGKIGFYHLIGADGSLKRYSSMIQMLQDIDREDLETLWKLIKSKYGNTRPKEGYERVLWGDLKPSFPLFLSSSSSSNPPTMDSTQASSSNPSKKIKLAIIPLRQLFVNISSDEDVTTIPSVITTSSPHSPPNAPSKTPSIKDTPATFGTASPLFESKGQSSPSTSNDTPSPQPLNPFLKNVMDAPPRPSHPLPLQSHPSLDITLSLSPITPLDHILDTSSPPLPSPQSQPPLMGHPIYFNYHDYYWSTCLYCFYSRNLIFSLRDEINLMFAHIEYLLNSTKTLLSPPHP
nr:hypothetical protein [Tanacetum cinerariifolium]